MQEKTKATNEKMMGTKTAGSGWTYATPEQRSAAIAAQAREKKIEVAALRK